MAKKVYSKKTAGEDAGKIHPQIELRAIGWKIVDGYVWCDFHGEVHEAKSDPYDDGSECISDDWTELWQRIR